jgi:hypothetical protein
VDWPDVEESFGITADEITFEKDTLFFRLLSNNVTYKGHINRDYSIINGEINGDMFISGVNNYGLDFGRKKLKRIIPVNYNSLPIIPAKVKVVKNVNPKKIPYTGRRVIEAGIPKPIEIDTTQLKVLTPGKGDVKNPVVYKLQEPITKVEYPLSRYYSQWEPVIIRAKQTKPVPAQPMRMKDISCFNLHSLASEQGLIDQDIRCILEDTKGNMWFGSNAGGVCRYDGKSFNYYTTAEGLTNNGIRAMIEDRSGNIWIGTDYGLCKYDGKSFTQYAGVIFIGILSLLETRNGDIWIGTQNGVVEKKGDSWIRYLEGEGLINNIAKSIIEDRKGNIWFGTQQGVCKYDGASFTHFTENDGLISNIVTSLIFLN